MTAMDTFKRNAAVTATEIDDGIFLVEPESQDIFFLDAVSSGLWRLRVTKCSRTIVDRSER